MVHDGLVFVGGGGDELMSRVWWSGKREQSLGGLRLNLGNGGRSVA